MGKIILIIIPTLKQGGAERIASELANNWSKQDNKVHLILLTKTEKFYTIDKNVFLHEFGFEESSLLKKIIQEVQILIKLRSLLKTKKPDLVISFMTKYNVFTLFASMFLNLKVFVSDRSNPRLRLPLKLKILRKVTYKCATGIIAQTSLAKNILEKQTKNKNIIVIPNPLRNVEIYDNIQKEKIILNVGRLVPEKGQKYLLESFKKLNNPDWKLVILGDGLLKKDIQEQARQLKIDHQLVMPGAVKNVDEWLAKSSIFAFTSISEGFPNALVEAMAAGLPCVSFNCDAGPRDIIVNNKNGFLVDVSDTNNFTNKLKLLTEDNKLRESLGSEAIKIREHLEVSKIAGKILEFCSQNLNK